jgi:hypothetical protein
MITCRDWGASSPADVLTRQAFEQQELNARLCLRRMDPGSADLLFCACRILPMADVSGHLVFTAAQ